MQRAHKNWMSRLWFLARLKRTWVSPDTRSWLTNPLRKSSLALASFSSTSLKKLSIFSWTLLFTITTMKPFKFTAHSVFIHKLVKPAWLKSTIVQVQEVSKQVLPIILKRPKRKFEFLPKLQQIIRIWGHKGNPGHGLSPTQLPITEPLPNPMRS